MTSLHTRLFGLIAISWASILLYFYASLRIKRYLAPDFHFLVLLSGIGILILGIYSLINPKEKSHHHHDCDHDHDHHACDHDHHACDHDHHACDHDHHDHDCDHHHDGHGPLVTALLTLAPLILALNYTKDSLSNTGLAKKGLYELPSIASQANLPPFTREDLEKRIPKNEHGEFQIRMITAYYAAGDREIQDIFDGLPVELEGRIAPEQLNNPNGDRLRIFRKIMTCCAADLQVVGISLAFPTETKRPETNAWVKAGGTLTFETIDNIVYPLLKVREIMPAEEPYAEFELRQ